MNLKIFVKEGQDILIMASPSAAESADSRSTGQQLSR